MRRYGAASQLLLQTGSVLEAQCFGAFASDPFPSSPLLILSSILSRARAFSSGLSKDGEYKLITWGRGDHGNLGHGRCVCLALPRFPLVPCFSFNSLTKYTKTLSYSISSGARRAGILSQLSSPSTPRPLAPGPLPPFPAASSTPPVSSTTKCSPSAREAAAGSAAAAIPISSSPRRYIDPCQRSLSPQKAFPEEKFPPRIFCQICQQRSPHKNRRFSFQRELRRPRFHVAVCIRGRSIPAGSFGCGGTRAWAHWGRSSARDRSGARCWPLCRGSIR